MTLNERQQAQVTELNDAIEMLAAALAAGDLVAAANCARAVEVEAFALGLMLRGGRR